MKFVLLFGHTYLEIAPLGRLIHFWFQFASSLQVGRASCQVGPLEISTGIA